MGPPNQIAVCSECQCWIDPAETGEKEGDSCMSTGTPTKDGYWCDGTLSIYVRKENH